MERLENYATMWYKWSSFFTGLSGKGETEMKKTIHCQIHCPFTHRSCVECAIYRGRHHYLISSKWYRGDTDKPRDPIAAYFQALERYSEPWAGKDIQRKKEINIRLKVIDMESGRTKICELNETKTWDWGNPERMRLINGRQVNSFDSLMEILCYKAEKGYQEVEIYEAPRFILLAGG